MKDLGSRSRARVGLGNFVDWHWILVMMDFTTLRGSWLLERRCVTFSKFLNDGIRRKQDEGSFRQH